MRAPLFATAIALIGLAAVACDNRNSNQARNEPPAAAPAESAVETPAPTVSEDASADAIFVEKVAIAGLFEIESSELALQRATKPQLKEFAQMMVTDHTTANNELKDLVGSGQVSGVTHVPSALDAEHQAKLEALKAAANGPAFDAKYQALQLEGHRQAVALFEAQANKGDNPRLKDLATKTLPQLKLHLSRIEGIAP
jgi:putative membrane protein